MKRWKKYLAIGTLVAGIAAVTGTAVVMAADGKQPTETVSMYRMYNPNSGEHFYTAKVGERDYLNRIGWNYEGIGWTAPETSGMPVYRLYNPNAGDHHYTLSAGEKDYLDRIGWNYEGIGWYSALEKGGIPVYREYNPNAATGSHNFTTRMC